MKDPSGNMEGFFIDTRITWHRNMFKYVFTCYAFE